MGMDVGAKKGPRSDINITPLVDVVLVLLIIFMVLTPLMEKEIAVRVPEEQDQTQPVGGLVGDPPASPDALHAEHERRQREHQHRGDHQGLQNHEAPRYRYRSADLRRVLRP